MATNRWISGQKSTFQVVTDTITTYDVATTYKATIGSKVYSVIAAGSANLTAAALQALLAASDEPEFLEVTWTVLTNVITATAVTAGTPFTVTFAVSGGIGAHTQATATANTSPNDVNDGLNWSSGTVPANSEDVYIDHTSQSLLWNLSALSAVTTTSITIGQSFSGTIGLPEINESGYEEYRPQYWSIQSSTLNVGSGSGDGSGRIKINSGSGTLTTVNVFNTGSPDDSPLEALLWKGTNAGNILNVMGGSVGIAVFGAELATVATLKVSTDPSGIATPPSLRVGSLVTLGTLTQESGTSLIQCAGSTFKIYAGTLQTIGSGAITVLDVWGGQALIQSTGTIGTMVVGPAAITDLSGGTAAITLSAVTLVAGSTLNDPAYRGVYSSGIVLQNCKIADVTLDLGPARTLTPS